MKNTYSKRVWLNKPKSPSTGSVAVYHGPIKWGRDEEEEIAAFLEIAGCHGKTRLHLTHQDKMSEFIKKMKLLRDTVNGFIDHLETDIKEKENGSRRNVNIRR